MRTNKLTTFLTFLYNKINNADIKDDDEDNSNDWMISLMPSESAKASAPCIVFIDEFDSVGAKRTNSSVHPHANQTVNQLLSEMDG